MHHGRTELGRFATGLPPGAMLSADAFISQQVFGMRGATSNSALSSGAASDLSAQIYGKHALPSFLPTLDIGQEIKAGGAVTALGGMQPAITRSLVINRVTAGTPFTGLVNAGNPANARHATTYFDNAGKYSFDIYNDAYSANAEAFSFTGTSAAISLFRIPKATNVLLGHTAAYTVASSARLQITGTSGGDSQQSIGCFSADAFGPALTFAKSRNATAGSNTIVQAEDSLGSLLTYGNNGSGWNNATMMRASVDGTPGASNDMPSRWSWWTCPDGSGNMLEGYRLNSQQEILVGVTTRNASGGKLQIKGGAQTTNNANVGGTTYYNVTQTGNGALTETNAFSHTIAASTLATNGDTLEFEAAGTFTASASVDKRVKVVFGTTTIFDTGALAITGATDWALRGTIIRTGAATQKAAISMNTSAAALMAYCDYTAPTETLANALTLKLTINATLANDVVAEFYKEKWFPGA